jgi:choline-sulfatase
MTWRLVWLLCLALVAACAPATPVAPRARNLVLITIDTLRADHVGAYGWTRARTPSIDGIARRGSIFERAYAAAPITLPSHATLMTGRYPPDHAARDNGMRVSDSVATLATILHARGLSTAAFVAAFPLDHQFGLNRGFDVYSDPLPRGPDGRLSNERPASQVVGEAIAWLDTTTHAAPRTPRPFFLWVHLFEPHAPYGDQSAGSQPVLERYDEEIATADREIGRILTAIAPSAAETLIIVAGDHGEAFGEHGEYSHSIFVYDTTLRVPLLMSGPGIRAGTRVREPVTLADVAPTAARMLGAVMENVDGIDLAPALEGTPLPRRDLYAESFAPLIEFGWAPLRAIRAGSWKYIAAPRAELFDIDTDSSEQINVLSARAEVARGFDERVGRYSGDTLPSGALTAGREAATRLRALGYLSGSSPATRADRPDPKDRVELAARIAQVTSGELDGGALVSALEGILREDPQNGQAHLRLAYARLQAGDCAHAEPEFRAGIASGLPSADAHLGLATCLGRRNDLAGAERALIEARRLEPHNPAVLANAGILQASRGDLPAAIASLQGALAADPGLDEARFNLAVAFAKAGRRADAAATARDLLARLPANAPQRAEVERLIRAVR